MIRLLIPFLISGILFAQQRTEPAHCFPFESLSSDDRVIAEQLLLQLMDSEALYTLATSIRPVSLGSAYLFISADQRENHPDLFVWKRISKVFQCTDDLEAEVIPTGPVYRGKQFWHFVIARRSAVRRAESENLKYFSQFGLEQSRGAIELFRLVDQSPRSEVSYEGYGYLLGHPQYSVRFGLTAQRLRRERHFIPAGSYSVKTFDEKGLQLSWSTPLNHVENSEDLMIKTSAVKTLEEYKKRREKFIGSDKPGAAALVRDWFCGEKGCRLPE